jgi:hypothetical protein
MKVSKIISGLIRTALGLMTVLVGVGESHAQPDSLWSHAYGGGGNDVCESLIRTNDGGYALAGWTDSFGAGGRDFWLVKTNLNGDSLWSRTYGGGGTNMCQSLVQTADGGYALAGTNEGHFWLVRTNADGDILWSGTYGEGNEVCNAIIQCAEGGFALAGYTSSFGAGENDFWLVRTSANGIRLWSQTYGSGNNDLCYSLIQSGDGGLDKGIA